MAWEVYETGKQWREADGDVAEAIDYCEYYARENGAAEQAVGAQRAGRGECEPLGTGRGVAVVIAPWNFPLAILLGHDDGGAGERQHRGDETSGAVGRRWGRFMEALEQAGFPPGWSICSRRGRRNRAKRWWAS